MNRYVVYEKTGGVRIRLNEFIREVFLPRRKREYPMDPVENGVVKPPAEGERK